MPSALSPSNAPTPCLTQDMLAAFAEGHLPAQEAEKLDEHVNACERCRALMIDFMAAREVCVMSLQGLKKDVAQFSEMGPGSTEVVAEDENNVVPTRAFPRGSSVGRYVILDPIGGGAMGVVYRAYDPELDRRVAIKVVRYSDAVFRDAAKERLLKEARALARLSHPNVVAVYDVGTIADQVFIAMELVDGCTLRYWVQSERREPAQILRVFVAAGEGVAAAHGAGLVHRDFKPDNVLVSSNGRVRVTDFGLAREVEPRRQPDEGSGAPDARSGSLSGMAGTPAYMAPEQLAGQGATVLSDQFSFCVALCEALVGRVPGAERPVRFPPLPALPSRLKRALQRGLSLRPEDRFRSMDALLAQLSRKSAWPRVAAVAAGALATATVFAFWTTKLARSVDQLCRQGAHQLEQSWNPAASEAIRKQFLATHLPYAAETFDKLRLRVDDYIQSWNQAYAEACRAAPFADKPVGSLDRQMSCLSERQDALAALLDEFHRASPTVVERSLGALSGLPAISTCGDVHALATQFPLPSDPNLRKEIAAQQKELAKLDALTRSGQESAALEKALAVVAAAEKLGHRPLQAKALSKLGDVQWALGKSREAEQTLKKAFGIADETQQDYLAARIASLMVRVADDANHHEAASLWAANADAKIRRIGGNDLLSVELGNALGTLHVRRGELDEGTRIYQRCWEMLSRVRESDARLRAIVANNLGIAYKSAGRFEVAEEYYRKSVELSEALYGSQHPSTVSPHINLGWLYFLRRKPAEAAEEIQRGLRVEEAVAPQSRGMAVGLLNLANVYNLQHRYGEAAPTAQRAYELELATRGFTHLGATALSAWGDALDGLGKYRQALAKHLQARARIEVEAAKMKDPARELAEVSEGLARDYIHLGQPHRAIPLLEQTLSSPTLGREGAFQLTSPRLLLARALWDARRSRSRACQLARQAIRDWGDEEDLLAQDVQLWRKRCPHLESELTSANTVSATNH